MKKLITLVVASCMVLGSLGAAAAIDVKVSGQWWFQYGYYSNTALVKESKTGKHADALRARQRIRTQIQFIADENLSAMLNLEANMNWGNNNSTVNGAGGALDADQTTFVIKRAYLDWTLPNTQIKTRMGMQGIAMPSATFGNPVMDADVAGISVSSQFTPNVGLTVFWARPYDQSYYADSGTYDQSNDFNSMDDMDLFGFMLPIKTDVVRATPWGMFSFIGKDSGFFKSAYNYNRGARNPGVNSGIDSNSYGWWLGSSFELPILDPFFVKLDAMVGGLETGKSEYDTTGWMVAGDIGYKFSFGALSTVGFYSSGDKDKDDLGQLPIVSEDGGFTMTRYGLGGTANRSWDGLLSRSGQGMWGIGLKLADVSFIDNLKHTAQVTYMGGTNQGDSQNNRRSVTAAAGLDRFSGHTLMSSDRAWEIDLLNQYKVTDNLTLALDLAYVWLDLGDQWQDKGDTKGSFATMVGVAYSF